MSEPDEVLRDAISAERPVGDTPSVPVGDGAEAPVGEGAQADSGPARSTPGVSSAGALAASPGDLAARAEARVTDDHAVDEALRVLDGLADQPLRSHVAAFDAVHGALQDRLADAEA